MRVAAAFRISALSAVQFAGVCKCGHSSTTFRARGTGMLVPTRPTPCRHCVVVLAGSGNSRVRPGRLKRAMHDPDLCPVRGIQGGYIFQVVATGSVWDVIRCRRTGQDRACVVIRRVSDGQRHILGIATTPCPSFPICWPRPQRARAGPAWCARLIPSRSGNSTARG